MSKSFPVLRGELVNNVVSAGTDLKKRGRGKHLQPGVVTYDNPDGTKTTYLLELDGIAAMRPTAAGIPVVGKSGGFDHAKIQPGKEYDGKVIDSFWDGESGWEAFNFDGMNAETAEACEDGFQFSCAYIPTETDGKSGLWHNVPYDEKILNGKYTHVAVVPVPRYDGAEIELLNSIGGKVNDTIKKLVRAIMPAAALRELANAAEADEKDAKKAKAKEDFENALKNAKDDAEKEKAKKDFENAMAAADKPGSADDAEKKNAEERKNKIAALRNAGMAVDKAMGAGKGAEYHNEADRLEKLPLGGGDVVPDPGVVQAGLPPKPLNAADDGAEAAKADEAEAARALTLKNEADAAKKEEDEARAMLANTAAAWPSFVAEMIAPEIAAKVLVNKADRKPIAFEKQPDDVRSAWKDAYRGAAGATVAERCNSLKAKAVEAVEIRNVAKKKAAEEAKKEAERTERFNSLRKAAAERGGGSIASFPLVGETAQEKAALGAELYG